MCAHEERQRELIKNSTIMTEEEKTYRLAELSKAKKRDERQKQIQMDVQALAGVVGDLVTDSKENRAEHKVIMASMESFIESTNRRQTDSETKITKLETTNSVKGSTTAISLSVIAIIITVFTTLIGLA